MRTMSLALAVISLAAPVPAAAQATRQVAANSQGAQPAKAVKYCIKDESTGSRVSGQTCKTKADWEREGIDIEKLLKR